MTWLSVDLPEPFGPMIACTSPGFTVSDSPWRISLSSTRTFRSFTSSNAVIRYFPSCPPRRRWMGLSYLRSIELRARKETRTLPPEAYQQAITAERKSRTFRFPRPFRRLSSHSPTRPQHQRAQQPPLPRQERTGSQISPPPTTGGSSKLI